MKITSIARENKKPKAFVSESLNRLYYKIGSIDSFGYIDLESYSIERFSDGYKKMAEREDTVPIYEGDSITITF